MGGHVVNLFVIMAAGVIIADLVIHVSGTTALFNGLGGLWASGVNGMLGQTTSAFGTAPTSGPQGN